MQRNDIIALIRQVAVGYALGWLVWLAGVIFISNIIMLTVAVIVVTVIIVIFIFVGYYSGYFHIH